MTIFVELQIIRETNARLEFKKNNRLPVEEGIHLGTCKLAVRLKQFGLELVTYYSS